MNRTSISLAVSDDVKDVSGKYFYNDALKQPDAHALDQEAAARLWHFSEQLVKEYEEGEEKNQRQEDSHLIDQGRQEEEAEEEEHKEEKRHHSTENQ